MALPTNSQHTVAGLDAAKSDAQTLQRTLNTNTNGLMISDGLKDVHSSGSDVPPSMSNLFNPPVTIVSYLDNSNS
jgi:hypothetical protein